MSSRRQMLEFLSLSRLPKEFQEVEYLESSGTQYIDSGFLPNQDTRIVANFEVVSQLSNYDDAFGARNGNTNQFHLVISWIGGTYFNGRYGEQQLNTTNTTLTTNHNVDFDKNVLQIDNLTALTFNQETFQSQYNAFIFGVNNAGVFSLPSAIKLSFLKIYDNNTIVRDFVPCYRKADNVAGLYDLVNGVFYTNAGTGTFITGGNV